MLEQESYNNFVQNTDIDIQDKLSGSNPQKVEKDIINKLKPKTLLDIGCGSGHRMFPFYEDCKIDYLGIEKFNNIIEQSKFCNKILCFDIGDNNFLQKFKDTNVNMNYDLIVLFGVINAFIDNDLRNNAWENISSLINKENKLVVNTLIKAKNSQINENWFSSNVKGEIIELPNTPKQYFYSEKELKNIFQEKDLKILEQIDEDHNYIKIRYYILIK